MNNVNPVLSTYGFDHTNALKKEPLQLLAEVSTSLLSRLSCSVQILEPYDSGPLEQQISDKHTPCHAHLLNAFSISHLPASKRVMPFIKPVNKDTQQHVQTTTVQFDATDSFASGGHLFPTLKEENMSKKYQSSKARYSASERGKSVRAKYAVSEKGKANRAKCRAKYLATDKGKKSRAKSRAKYAASAKGKLRQAISNAKANAYRSAIRKGFSEKAARQQGELAANNKREELSSMLSASLSSPC